MAFVLSYYTEILMFAGACAVLGLLAFVLFRTKLYRALSKTDGNLLESGGEKSMTVIICCHNEGDALETNLPKIMEQRSVKFEVVVVLPADDVLLADLVERADQGHAGVIRAAEHRRHRLQLRAPEQRHHRRLDHVGKVMPQRDLVAAELLRVAVEIAPPHPRAEIARRFFHMIDGGKDVALKDVRVHAQVFEVFLDHAAVLRAVAGVHDEELHLEGHAGVPVQLLHELGQQHRVLAAGDADCDLIPCLDQLVPLDRHDEGRPQLLAKLFDNAAFDFLISL